jgi:hypothetical protein
VVENMNMFHLPCHRKESQDRDQAEWDQTKGA